MDVRIAISEITGGTLAQRVRADGRIAISGSYWGRFRDQYVLMLSAHVCTSYVAAISLGESRCKQESIDVCMYAHSLAKDPSVGNKKLDLEQVVLSARIY